MNKLSAILLVSIFLFGNVSAFAGPHQLPESVASLERKLDIAEAKGELNQRQSLQLRRKLNTLIEKHAAIAKHRTPAATADFDTKVKALGREIEQEQHARKIAGRFWTNWF